MTASAMIVPKTAQKVTLAVSEIFGPTIQGEGPSMGRRCAFLRLAGCNLHCKWCDTAYTWRFSARHPHNNPQVYDAQAETTRMGINEIRDAVRRTGATMLVLTGGEPMLQQDALTRVLEVLKKATRTRWIEVETAGTILPRPEFDRYINRYNVSPKLSTSGNTVAERYKPETLIWFVRRKAAFKFVVTDPTHDLAEIATLAQAIHLPPQQTWIMPEATTRAELQDRFPRIARAAIDAGYNVSSRLHVEIWSNRRGV